MGQVCLLVIFRVEIADVGLVQGVGVGHEEARHAVLPLNLEFAAYYFTTELQGALRDKTGSHNPLAIFQLYE